ncbi:MAG: hypothetical protein ACQCXQ_13495 [Verrucomicrobiales bacterium]
MATFQHPASLNALQQFGQACSILRNTTRASNPAWYQEALDLGFQLHIRPDGPDTTTLYYLRDRNQWFPGPTLNADILEEPVKTETFISEALNYARSQGATSLGVILHVADEFATTELKPEFDNPAALQELRDAAINDPASILEDSSIQADLSSWRVLPYPAAGSEVIGTTITVTHALSPLLDAFRNTADASNFPIVTHALSAPLVALSGLDRALKPTAGKPFVVILQYPWFTALAFFNEHADLRLIRTLQHRGVRRPTNFRNALSTTSASLEFVDPDLFIVPLGQDVDTTMEANLRITFTSSRVEVLTIPHDEEIPAWCIEPFISVNPEPAPPTTQSLTFTTLREDKWAFQDFLPVPREVAEIHPNRSEMKLLRLLRLGRVAVVVATLLCIVWLAVGIIGIISKPEWGFDPSQASTSKTRLSTLSAERKKVDHWNNLLADRSKAWVNMEFLNRMFPENRGMLIKDFSHTAKPDSTAGQQTVGLVKEWKITGFARDEALEYLNNLNTRDGINAHFSKIARVTGNSAFNPNLGNRTISVNVRTQENSQFKPIPYEEVNNSDSSTYPFSFSLSITQRFESTDPMAVEVTKVP